MTMREPLDLARLAQFRARDLLAPAQAPVAVAPPMHVALSLVDFDASQPRRRIDVSTLDELAASVREHGVLEPVSLRPHPQHEGRYVVNRGERRVRAARRAGLDSVPAFLDGRVDPFAQAAENLHREDMSPFDLALFIAERERDGHTRAEIARRLGKPRSFITQAASLIDAPTEVIQAFEVGRVGSDVRLLYELAGAMKRQAGATTAMLSGSAAVTRASVAGLRSEGAAPSPEAPQSPAVPRTSQIASGGRTVLVVDHAGRRGSLRLKARANDLGEVRFGDGTCQMINLQDLRPVCWATEN